ncbi:DUF6268 family outer membrane beta-barrel protein [Akkermansiaceae bacterium]|jgi:hypothetical protein|nr:DUF6268 family outer membrane beta-barrel protein [Akkermansiaceae bacterium]
MLRYIAPALLASSLFSVANIDPEPEDRSPMTAMPGRFGALFGGASQENGGSDFTWEQLTLQGGFGLRKEFSDELKLFYGVNYRFTRIDEGNFASGADLDHLHDIILPFSLAYTPSDSPWSFFAQVSGQLATDFNSITSDDLDYTARLGGQYEFSDKFSLNFGVARVRNFGESFVLPALGCTWEPTDDWSFTILGPRITLSHRISDRFIVRAGGFPTGGLWNVEDDAGNSVDYGFASYNAGMGIDFKLRRGVWLTAWAGANFANELRAEQNGNTIFEEELDSGFFGYIGINLYEW